VWFHPNLLLLLNHAIIAVKVICFSLFLFFYYAPRAAIKWILRSQTMCWVWETHVELLTISSFLVQQPTQGSSLVHKFVLGMLVFFILWGTGNIRNLKQFLYAKMKIISSKRWKMHCTCHSGCLSLSSYSTNSKWALLLWKLIWVFKC